MSPSPGANSKVARKARSAMLEEFLQAGEDWSQSSFVAVVRHAKSTTKRGKYRLMSREDSVMQLVFSSCQLQH